MTIFLPKRKLPAKVNINQVINEFDELLGNIIEEKFSQLSPEFKVVNALSGGTDSSFIQYYLKKNKSDIAYTANFIKGGLDHAYASDVSELMNLKHKTIHTDTDYLIDGLPDGIYFDGETLYVWR